MSPTDEALLAAWQSNRDADALVLAAIFAEALQPPDYTRELAIVSECMSEEPMTDQEDEAALQFALVGFRTMNPEMQSAFLVGAMDEFCRKANGGEVDEQLAGQLLTRAQLIASRFVKAEAA